MGPDPALDELSRICRGRLTLDPTALDRLSRDASPFHQMPRAAVQPRDAEDVVALVTWARRFRVPLVARGGGSSLDGESVPAEGGVVVDFSAWDAILELDDANRLARVQPGVINRELHRALVPRGLFFPPNPGSWTFSTLGGNVATNASGMRSFRYGATRAWVRGIEAVLGTGERVRLGHRARKSSTGPGLLGFMVGSEGTLALFTEITVALAPLPGARMGVVIPVPQDRDIGELALRLVASPLPLSAIEYVDKPTAESLAEVARYRIPGDCALLLLEFESAQSERDRIMALAEEWLATLGFGGRAEVYPDADELWTLRGQSGDLLDRRLGARLREDVAVPLPRVGELLREIARIAQRAGVQVQIYAHLGDGNLHPNFVLDPTGEPAKAIRRELVLAARRMGGTISGEHGIGLAKGSFMGLEHGADGVSVLRRMKQVFDPDGILNPGKLYPEKPLTTWPS